MSRNSSLKFNKNQRIWSTRNCWGEVDGLKISVLKCMRTTYSLAVKFKIQFIKLGNLVNLDVCLFSSCDFSLVIHESYSREVQIMFYAHSPSFFLFLHILTIPLTIMHGKEIKTLTYIDNNQMIMKSSGWCIFELHWLPFDTDFSRWNQDYFLSTKKVFPTK